MAKMGRPSVYTPEVVTKILELVALGETEYSVITKKMGLDWVGWWRFKSAQDEDFLIAYTHARDSGLKTWENRILEIAEDQSRDQQEYEKYSSKTGELIERGMRSDNTAVNRDRLKVDSMKWLMSKMAPNLYSDKNEIMQQITNNQSAVTINVLSSAELKKAVNAVSKQKQIEEKTAKD